MGGADLKMSEIPSVHFFLYFDGPSVLFVLISPSNSLSVMLLVSFEMFF